METMDLGLVDYMKFVLALVFVLGLIGLTTVAARKFGFGIQTKSLGTSRRLAIVEALNIDGKRRLVLIRRDDTEHLLVLGASTELLVESAIDAAPESTHPSPPPLTTMTQGTDT